MPAEIIINFIYIFLGSKDYIVANKNVLQETGKKFQRKVLPQDIFKDVHNVNRSKQTPMSNLYQNGPADSFQGVAPPTRMIPPLHLFKHYSTTPSAVTYIM